MSSPAVSKSNFMHFSIKIWHLVASNLLFFFLRIYWPCTLRGGVGPERGTAAAGAVLMVQLPSRQQSGRVAPTECVYSQRLIAQLMRRRRCSHRIGKSLPNFCYCHCSPHSMRSLTVNGPSVCLSHSPATAACGGFAAVGSAPGDIDRLLHNRRRSSNYCGQWRVYSVRR